MKDFNLGGVNWGPKGRRSGPEGPRKEVGSWETDSPLLTSYSGSGSTRQNLPVLQFPPSKRIVCANAVYCWLS